MREFGIDRIFSITQFYKLASGAISLISLLMSFLSVSAQTSVDTVNSMVHLEQVEVVSSENRTPLRIADDGSMVISSRMIGSGVSQLGAADMMTYIKRLPGITATSDYASGVVVDGADMSQTLYRIGAMPIFFPYHFSGMFSTFNTPHFANVKVEKSIHDASLPDRVGGLFDFATPSFINDRLCGTIDVGMLASSVSLQIPMSKNLAAVVSARRSYINMLYKSLMDTKSTTTRYGFTDLNFTLNYAPRASDNLKMEFFYNDDRLRLNDANFAMNVGINWHNLAASIAWRHISRNHKIDLAAWCSEYGNTLLVDMQQVAVDAPAMIREVGAKGAFSQSIGARWSLECGYDMDYSVIEPISAWSRGFTGSEQRTARYHQQALRMGVYGDLDYRIGRHLSVSGGVRAVGYANGSFRHFSVSPQMRLLANFKRCSVTAQSGVYRQYKSQLGFGDIGMASSFWIGSDENIKPTISWTNALTLKYPLPFFDTELSVGGYYKRLWNVPEYYGGIMDLAKADYDVLKHVSVGDGYATGFDVGVYRNKGRATGMVNYAYAVGRRRFDGSEHYVTAANEIRHSLSAEISYRASSHVDVGAYFTYSTGRPVSSIKSVYMIGETVITQYGERNATRLPDYHRLNLSATYRFVGWLGRVKLNQSVNVAVVNVYNHRNAEMQLPGYDSDKGTMYIWYRGSLFRLLPSLSYKIEF